MGINCKKKPCANCPYRKDAPLALWSVEEFERLLDTENDVIGSVFGCHKKDDTICTGWLVKQIERDFPSNMMRMRLITSGTPWKDLDHYLENQPEMYATVLEMALANFPEEFKNHIDKNSINYSFEVPSREDI